MFQNVKSGQLVLYCSFEFFEATTKFSPSCHTVNLPGNQNIAEPEAIRKGRKIDETLKIDKLERKCSQIGDTYINSFKIADDDLFNVQWYVAESEFICGHNKSSESDVKCAECQGKLQW